MKGVHGMVIPDYIIICCITLLLLLLFTPILYLSFRKLYCTNRLSLERAISASSRATSNKQQSDDENKSTSIETAKNEQHDDQDLNKWFKCSSMTAITWYYLALFCNVLMVLFVLIYNADNAITYSMSIMMPLFYFIADWSRLLIFTLRIDYSFRDSSLAYSNGTMRCLYFSTFFMLFLVFIIMIMLGMGLFDVTKYIASLYCLMDVTLSIVFTVLFLKRLFFIILKRIEFKIASAKESSTEQKLGDYMMKDMNDTSCAPKQNSLENRPSDSTKIVKTEQIKMVTRYTFLVCVAVISTFLALIIAIIVSMYGAKTRVFWDESDVPIKTYSLLGIDSVVNGLCIYLLFGFSVALYSKLCNCGNTACTKCCICFIMVRLKDKINRDGDVSLSQYHELILND